MLRVMVTQDTLTVNPDMDYVAPAPKSPTPDLSPAIAHRAIEQATLALLVALHDATGDLVAFDVAQPVARRVIGAYFDAIQGMAR